MFSHDFVGVYDREIDESEWRIDSAADILHGPRSWSHEFGVVLYDSLHEPTELPQTRRRLLDDYRQWHADQPLKIEDDILDNVRPGDMLKAANEANFHALNIAMAHMWTPIIAGEWASRYTPEQLLTRAQETLAYQGLELYRKRIAVGPQYFNPENRKKRASLEGMINEYDAGIAKLEAVKVIRKVMPDLFADLTVIPGPMQFEHGHKPMYNVDFLDTFTYRDKRYVTGTQVKTNIHLSDEDRYDPKRVILLGATEAFDNEMVRQVGSDPADTQLVSWGGLLCAEVARDARSHGPAAIAAPDKVKHKPSSYKADPHIKRMDRYRYYAHELIGPERHHLTDAAHSVLGQLVPKLVEYLPGA